jgi:hypothetical protein
VQRHAQPAPLRRAGRLRAGRPRDRATRGPTPDGPSEDWPAPLAIVRDPPRGGQRSPLQPPTRGSSWPQALRSSEPSRMVPRALPGGRIVPYSTRKNVQRAALRTWSRSSCRANALR